MKAAPRHPWLLCWLLFTASALSFLDRQVLSVLSPQLMREFGMSSKDYSNVVFAFILTYTVMFGLAGRVVDYLGTRLGLGLSVAVWSVASAGHALARNAFELTGWRFLLGVGEGGCFPAATKGATEWFPVEKRAMAIGIATGGSAFGAVIAPPLTAYIAGTWGWRAAFLFTGIIGGAWVVAWFLASRGMAGATRQEAAAKPSFIEIMRMPGVARLLVSRFLFDPVFYFYMFWIPKYLSSERGLSVEQIGSRFWIPFLTLGITNILAGRLSDSLVARGMTPRRARVTLLTISALLTPALWLVPWAPSATIAIVMMCVLMAAHGVWISNFLAYASDRFPASAIASVVGFSGTAGGTAGMLATLATGRVVDGFGFTPLFVVSGILYPLALVVLVAGTRRKSLQ